MSSSIDLASAQVLITGGSEGIGLGLAQRFLKAGSTVVVTGRSQARLRQAESESPGLKTFVSDIGSPQDREQLAEYITNTLPALNVVINNAGIQRRVSLAEDHSPWQERQAEIDILLAGPIHLNDLLIPAMLRHGLAGMIANVTSGGAYLPQPFAPIYSACKAALHSYTVNLRFALRDTSLSVVEIIPPAVRTALAGAKSDHGAPLDDFCDHIFSNLIAEGIQEIGFGATASEAFNAPKSLYRQLFSEFSERFPVRTYADYLI